MFKTFNVELDVKKQISNYLFSVSSNDLNTIRLDFVVKNGSIPFDLTGKLVRLAIKKPDGTNVLLSGGITSAIQGRCESILSRQANLVPGKHEAEIMIFEGSETVAVTSKFNYEVRKAIITDKDVKSSDDYPALNAAIQAGEMLQDIDIANVIEAGERVDGIQRQFNDAKTPIVGTPFLSLSERLNDSDDKVKSNAVQLEEAKLKGINLIRNSNFEKIPPIYSRSSIYSFTVGISSPKYSDKKTLKIDSVNYESNADTEKDFAFILDEQVGSQDKVRVKFMVYPLISNKTISIRMAYTAGITVNLGEANRWNEIDVLLNLTDITVNNSYLYFNSKSSFSYFMSDIFVTVEQKKANILIDNPPESLKQVNHKLLEQPTIIKNSTGIIERMIEVGQSYLDNIEKFVYGNSYTAYDKTVQLVGGKYQIDCSSFASLLLHGIDFKNSRYNGNPNNKDSNLFFNNIDSYTVRYAYQMGKYAFDKGYAFMPNNDFSNVEPGDVLFFSWDNYSGGDLNAEQRENAFMKIDHVGIFLNQRNEKIYSMLQLDNGFTSVLYSANETYIKQCVLAARFPLTNVESLYSQENILVNGNVSKSTNGSTFEVGTYNLYKPLEKGKSYTVLIDGAITTDDTYFILQANGQTFYSDFGRVNRYIGLVECHFPYLLSDSPTQIKVLLGSSGSVSIRNATINWISLYEGFVRNKTEYKSNTTFAKIGDITLSNQTIVDDIDIGLSPYYKYAIDNNKVFINFNLPLKTLRTGAVAVGTVPVNTVTVTQRIPVNLIGSTNSVAVNGILQISQNGTVSVIPFDNTQQWRYVMGNGCVFR